LFIPLSPKPTIVSLPPSSPPIAPGATVQSSDTLETVTYKDMENDVLAEQEVLNDVQPISSTHISLDGLQSITQPSLKVLPQSVISISPHPTYPPPKTSIPFKTIVGTRILVVLGSVVGVGMIYFFNVTEAPNLPLLPCSSEPLPPPLPNHSPDKTYPDKAGIIKYYGELKDYGGGKDYAADGRGIMIFGDNSQYYGEFKNAKFHGCGTLIYPNGRTYVGQFRNGLFDGKGIWTLENKDKYIGDFKDAKCDGYGEFFFADGRLPHKGLWKEDNSVSNQNLSCDP